MATVKMRWGLAIVVLFFLGMISDRNLSAAGPKKEVTRDEKKESTDPTEEDSSDLGKLFRLEGKWRVEEEYPKSDDQPSGGTGKGTATYRKSLGDTYLIGDYSSKSKEMGTDVKGHAVFTYDKDAQEYRYWWFDNYGSAQDFTGKHDAGSDSLVFTREFKDADSKQTLTDIHTFKFESDGTVVLTIEMGKAKDKHEQVLKSVFSKGAKKDDEAAEESRDRDARPAKVPAAAN